MMPTRKGMWMIIAGAAAAAAVVLIFLLLGPPNLLAKSDSPEFCAGCHVMQAEFDAWSHAGAHRRKQCVDCHLPNENAAVHYGWKAVDGLKDMLFFYSGRVPERITLTGHGAEVLQRNCVRCHEQTVMLISHDRKCWTCHRRLQHRLSGAMQTV